MIRAALLVLLVFVAYRYPQSLHPPMMCPAGQAMLYNAATDSFICER